MLFMTKTLTTTDGEIVIVDDDIKQSFLENTWRCDGGYPRCRINKKHFYLHRMIMDANQDQVVDHKNGDKLDCRKINLRFVTDHENAWNVRRCGVNCTRGVWQVSIMSKGINRYIGRYKTFDEARAARIQAEVDRSSEFCRELGEMSEIEYWLNRRGKVKPGNKPWEVPPRKNTKGEKNVNSKFTEEQVRKYKLLKKDGCSTVGAAKKAGLSVASACAISRGLSWGWLIV